VHRIGRTGRAGAGGTALSFCDAEEMDSLKQIHKLIGKTLAIIPDHPYTVPGITVNKALPQAGHKEQNKNNRFTRLPSGKSKVKP
jgi:ATP-dependent RNA helicase RhlE